MGSSLRCEVGRKKHLGREGSAAFISPSDSRDALFSRSACYSHRDLIRQLTAEAQLQRGAPHGPGPTAEPCGGSAFPPPPQAVPPEPAGWSLVPACGCQCRWWFTPLLPAAFLFCPFLSRRFCPGPSATV